MLEYHDILNKYLYWGITDFPMPSWQRSGVLIHELVWEIQLVIFLVLWGCPNGRLQGAFSQFWGLRSPRSVTRGSALSESPRPLRPAAGCVSPCILTCSVFCVRKSLPSVYSNCLFIEAPCITSACSKPALIALLYFNRFYFNQRTKELITKR